MGEMRNAYKILFGKLEGKIPLGRPTHSLEYNIRMVLREIGWEGMNWMHLVWDRNHWCNVVNKIMTILVL
jgi:hypothetical protein